MENAITINNLSELPIAAKRLLEVYPDKTIFAFYAEMGVGKTTLIKAICESLGVKDIISSPTFSIVNEYLTDKGEKIYHFDFYRIKSLSEAYDMGYEEYFYSNNYCFIEWAENINELLPPSAIKLKIVQQQEQRIVTVM